jgi:hypothetical protein
MKAIINENLFYLDGEYYLTEKRNPKYDDWIITDENVVQRVYYNEYNDIKNIIIASTCLLENCFYFKKPENNSSYEEFKNFLFEKGLEFKDEYLNIFNLIKDFFKEKYMLNTEINTVFSINFKIDVNQYLYVGTSKNIKGSGYKFKNYNYGRLYFDEYYDDNKVLGELIIDKIEYYEHIFA